MDEREAPALSVQTGLLEPEDPVPSRNGASRPPMPDLSRLRRLGVWLPVLALAVLVGLVGLATLAFRPDWPVHLAAYLLVMGIIATGAYLFSHSIFGIVEQKEAEILRRNQELATLNSVAAVINDSPDLDAILSRALDKVLEVTRAESGEILLWEESSESLVLRAFRGLHPQVFHEITRFKFAEGLPGRIVETDRVIVVRDLADDPRFLRRGVLAAGFRVYAGIPLRSKGRVVGVMAIFSLDTARLMHEDVDLLEAVGKQIAVAVENARLDARLKAMSLVEERHRIAREMHDGLAQELGYLHLKMGELESNPALASARDEILALKDVVARAYEEVRQAIFGLKMMVSRGLGLVPTLAEYLHDFGEQSGISVKLKVADEGATSFTPQQEIQLIRIVQEALSNVRKHARARRAWVTFEVDGEHAKVSVGDDGRGFDVEEAEKPGRGCFGLQTMRERAESTGGTLKVESSSGSGTLVQVWLALDGDEGSVWSQ